MYFRILLQLYFKRQPFGTFLWNDFISSQVPGTHLFNLRRIKCWVDLGATWWFRAKDLWIGSPIPQPLGHCSINCSITSADTLAY